MSDPRMRVPDESHPISVTPTGAKVTVTWKGKVIAQSTNALSLSESTYPVVQYIPRKDVSPDVLEGSEHTTYCPFKGTANYFSLKGDEGRAENAVWYYADPYDAVGAIKDHVAFYPNVVDAIEVA